MSKSEETRAKPARSYLKEQILASSKFVSVEKDLLSALLKSDIKYTLDEAETLLKDECKRMIRLVI